MRVVIAHEEAQGRQVQDVHEKNLGYDVTSLDPSSGELRLIEVRGPAGPNGTVLLTPVSKGSFVAQSAFIAVDGEP